MAEEKKIDDTTQHYWVVNNPELSLEEKLTELFMICEHLDNLLEQFIGNGNRLHFLNSLIERRKPEGYKLKVDQMGDEYKATFWRSKGDNVETLTAKDKDLFEAICLAGNKPEADEIKAMIRSLCNK